MPSCLVVDHSKIVRGLEKRMMAGLGYSVAEAEDGEQAVGHCKKEMPNLILLDWYMPVMNGLEFLKTLRAMPNGTTPKVVFCTTESEMKYILQALSAGADEYVIKPFNADIIKGKLQQIGVLPQD